MSLWLMDAAAVYDEPACRAALAGWSGCLARPTAEDCLACATNSTGTGLRTAAGLMEAGCGDPWIGNELLPRLCADAPAGNGESGGGGGGGGNRGALV